MSDEFHTPRVRLKLGTRIEIAALLLGLLALSGLIYLLLRVICCAR